MPAMIALSALLLCACAANPSRDGTGMPRHYPEHWWTPVPADQAASWEVLPQQAQPGAVILSKRNELGLLSNFAATPFELDGKRYASVEGFWQMLLYPEGPTDSPRHARQAGAEPGGQKSSAGHRRPDAAPRPSSAGGCAAGLALLRHLHGNAKGIATTALTRRVPPPPRHSLLPSRARG